MFSNTKETTSIVVAIILFSAVFINFAQAQTEEEAVMCTLDALQCADGSYVGRTGPNCEFVCPDTKSTSSSSQLDGQNATGAIPPQREQASSTERREQLQQNRAERQEIRAERQAALTAERQARVLNLSANLSNRMEAAIERLYKIIARFETRIKKLQEVGLDTSSTEAQLRSATEHLAKARTTLQNIDTAVQAATTATEPQNRWITVRETYKQTGISIKASHLALRTAVQEIKTAANKNSTSTTTVPTE